MATNQQAIANKNNAAKSTGPKTGGGNALKHGLQSSTRLLLHDEDPKALAELRDALGDELRPSTALQQILFLIGVDCCLSELMFMSVPMTRPKEPERIFAKNPEPVPMSSAVSPFSFSM